MKEQAARVMPVVVVLPAEIDVTNSEQVHNLLIAAMAPGVDIVIADMTSTSFCDSSGVHAVMFAHEAAVTRDIRLRIAVTPDGSVQRVLQLIGASRILSVHSSLSAAIAADLVVAAHRQHRHIVLARAESRHHPVRERLHVGVGSG